jgi:low density lipoprotein-related protein 2
MYITDWRLDAIIKLHKLTGELEEVLVREPQTNRLYGVKVYSGSVQTVDHNQPCSINNGGCEKICFAIPRNNTPGLQVGHKLIVSKESLRQVQTFIHYVVFVYCVSVRSINN